MRASIAINRKLVVALLLCIGACGGDDEGPGAGGISAGAGGTGGSASGSGGSGGAGGAAGVSSTSGAGGIAGGGTGGAGAGGAGAGGAGGEAGGPPMLPASCADAANAYTITGTMLDASFVVAAETRSWGGGLPRTPVAVDSASGQTFVGYTRADGDARSVVMLGEDGSPVAGADNATVGGIAVTKDGFAVLAFDPNEEVDARMWVRVERVFPGGDSSGAVSTDLFNSPNLEDEGTKGAPTTARFTYVAETDQVVAYFGHTQRYDDGVRHQGGYLATIDAMGNQELIEGWFGSHNLDQRMLVDGDRVAVIGLGDAFPKGIFFSYIDDARTNVIYRLAADGVGTTNGQLGGMIDLGDRIALPFITNRSVAQDLDAGEWPDIDETISMQIRDAAEAGTDMGIMFAPKASLPDGDLEPTWLDPQVTAGARLASLKSVQYGDGELMLLAWAELSGEGRNPTATYFTMIVDSDGAVCQPKTELPESFAFNAGDDLVRKPDGRIVWANVQNDQVQIITLTP